MGIVTVDQAQEGMVLSEPVSDSQGRLLIPAGHTLQERHLRALKMWGVPHVEVEGEHPEDRSQEDLAPWALEAAENALDRRFALNDPEHEVVAALRREACAREARRIQNEGEAPHG